MAPGPRWPGAAVTGMGARPLPAYHGSSHTTIAGRGRRNGAINQGAPCCARAEGAHTGSGICSDADCVGNSHRDAPRSHEGATGPDSRTGISTHTARERAAAIPDTKAARRSKGPRGMVGDGSCRKASANHCSDPTHFCLTISRVVGATLSACDSAFWPRVAAVSSAPWIRTCPDSSARCNHPPEAVGASRLAVRAPALILNPCGWGATTVVPSANTNDSPG